MRPKHRIDLVCALLILAAASLSWAANPPKPPKTAKPPKAAKAAKTVKAAALQTATATPVSLDWPTYGNQFDNARFQNVDQINTKNVKNLAVAWVFHTGVLDQFATLELSPIVINGVMYAIDGHDNVFAINAATGAQVWAFRPTDLPAIDSLPLCCGRNNRGVAVGGGKVYFGRLDNIVMALDQTTGAEVWRTTLASPAQGYSITDAAQYVTTAQHPNGLVIIGLQGGEYEARGQVFALDATTGNPVWQFFTAQGPNGWGGNGFLTGGGMVWNPPSIDTSLGLMYIVTGNAAPDILGQNRPGNNPFTASVVALSIDTGNVIWSFQEVHHDIWDYDATSTAVLFNVTSNGVTTPAIGHCSKNGNYYILDRRNGKPLFPVTETSFPTTPAYQNASPTQPVSSVGTLTPLTFVRPNTSGIPGVPQYTPPDTQEVLIQPGSQGGCEWPAAAFSPRTNLVYYGARYQPTSYQTKPNNTDTQSTPGQTPPETVGSAFGRSPAGINAFGIFGGTNVNTGKIAWSTTTTQPATSSLLVAGDILFYGEDNGVFHGVNAATGASLFTFNGPQQVVNAGGANGGPIAYVVNSVEYIVMPFGGNALERQNFPPDPVGDAIIAFKLP